jgi:hypothetical protein
VIDKFDKVQFSVCTAISVTVTPTQLTVAPVSIAGF